MPESILIPQEHAANHLQLTRVLLSQDAPVLRLPSSMQERCLYSLIGGVDITLAWPHGHHEQVAHLEAARRTVQEPAVHLLRLPVCNNVTLTCIITFTLTTYAADLLCVSCASRGEALPIPADPETERFLLQDLCYNHEVGVGTHHRFVREIPTPPGYSIHCGETMNDPGAWSSWPSHAAPYETDRWAEHEELFFVVTPGYGIMRCDGRYPDGKEAPRVQEVHNGEGFRTPLGSHEIVFSPGDWGWYFWAYRSFLKKQYNRFATDGVKTYIK